MAEKRLIDANALMTKVQRYADEPDYQHTGENWRNGVRAIEYEISIAPTVDAVEVVRCKDCKFSGMYCFWPSHNPKLACLDIEEDGFVRMATTVNPDGYCSKGERKDNDDN